MKLDRTHCPQGHEYTPENTYLWHGSKVCRTCRKARAARENLERRSWRKVPGLSRIVKALRGEKT